MKPIENELTEELSQIEDGDFVFVINSDGELKTVLMPEDAEFSDSPIPTSIMKIFKIFGIKNLTQQSIH